MTKHQAICVHWLMYSECYDLTTVTPKVDSFMKQIARGMRKLNESERKLIVHEVHKSWILTKQQVFPKTDELIVVEFAEILLTLYNNIPKMYQNIFYTDNTFTKVSNSFLGALSDIEEDIGHTSVGRKLAEVFLKEIGVERIGNPLLNRMKTIKAQNLIVDGRV